jgi:hypothetical protein
MYIICGFCKEKLPVVVSNWNILPVQNSSTCGQNLGIRIGQIGEISIDPDTSFKIIASPSSYRCRNCGYEKEYSYSEILFS